MKHRLFERLEAHMPVGINGTQEFSWLGAGYGLSILFSLSTLLRLNSAYQNLFERIGSVKVLKSGAIMPGFVEVLGNGMAGFLIVGICMLLLAAYHYAYHYQGSKSIYLMRRIPNRWELHRRCLTLPALAIGVATILPLLLTLLYLGIYYLVVPENCLPGGWFNFWIID